GLARQMLKGKLTGEAVRAKDYLYALRALLAASWVSGGKGIAPVPFGGLLAEAPEEIRAEIPALLEHKARTGEGERMPRNPVIDSYLEKRLVELDDAATSLGRGPGSVEPLDRLLRREIHSRKTPVMTPGDFTLERIRKDDMLLFDSVAG